MKWGSKLFYSINVLLSVVTLLSYLSPYVDPSLTWFFSFFGLGFPILLMCNLAFIVFWLLAKSKKIFLPIITLALGYGAMIKSIGFNMSKEVNGGVKIMTYNIGHSINFLKDENHLSEFKAFVKEQNPSIICIQERAKKQMPLYDSIFSEYTLYPNDFIGTCIYSKLPIINSGNISFDTKAHNATWADIQVGNKILRVYSIHLSSNKIKNLTDDFSDIWDESIFILDKYNMHSVRRKEQMIQILDHAKSSPYPVMITGDFNDVPMSFLYRMICTDYKDAFIDHGTGFAKTHNTKIPILRIDYLFHSDGIKILDQDVVCKDYSDHFPIITTFDL